MAKPRPKPRPAGKLPRPLRTPPDPEAVAARRRFILKSLAVVVTVAALAASFILAKGKIERDYAFGDAPPRVVLLNRPAWMSDLLVRQLIASVQPTSPSSALDHKVLVNRVNILRASPWVREIRSVRRVYGDSPGDTLEIDCDWRTPAALVASKDVYYLVDDRGVALPETFDNTQLARLLRTEAGHINLRIIEGVAHGPVGPGMSWPGDDLRAGIELAAALYGHDYADEIDRINVSNFAGRINPADPQLALITKYNTELRWGRPVSEKDFFVEVSWQRKLRRLEEIVRRYGRVDAGKAWVELRWDTVDVPAEPQSAATDLR